MEQTKPRISPRNFFLQIGAIVAFYVSVVSFIALLFQYIDVLFPDQLNSYYYDPYSGAIRWAIAALVVIFPVFIWLSRMINNDLEKDPDNRDSGLRRWLTYLTLFVAGITIVIDLVAVINVFLGGEITTRFILKAVAILAVAVVAFGYYVADLRGYWLKNRNASKSTGWAALAVVLISVVSGFLIIGSPMAQRAMRFDRERADDLSNIQWQIVSFWQDKGALPEKLDDISNSISGYQIPADPETGEAYIYKKTGLLAFQLCADFNRPSDDPVAPRGYYNEFGLNGNWSHEEGTKCFDRIIDPDRYPVRKI